MMRCAQSDDPAGFLIRMVVKQVTQHQPTEAVSDEMHDGLTGFTGEGIQALRILGRTPSDARVGKPPCGIAGLVDPVAQEAHVQAIHPQAVYQDNDCFMHAC